MTDRKLRGLAAASAETKPRVSQKGGLASASKNPDQRPFKDPGMASRAAKARWDKWRLTQG